MESLALGGLRVLRGQEEAHEFVNLSNHKLHTLQLLKRLKILFENPKDFYLPGNRACFPVNIWEYNLYRAAVAWQISDGYR